MVLDPGTVLERFTIIRHLGSGRGAHVYLAQDAIRGHEVALKVADLRPEEAARIEARMRRELDVRLRVGNHSHVLALFDAYPISIGGLDLFVLSMEHADGGDFRQWLVQAAQESMANPVSGFLHVLQAARGLATLHRAGVVHLDIKPENLFCVRGVWKVGDLDHARSIDEPVECNPTQARPDDYSNRLGTPGYASPEALSPGSPAVDPRADIYSLGVVLRDTLPHAGCISPNSRRSDRKNTAPAVTKILRRCLAQDPNDRFQLVEHVVEAMEDSLNVYRKEGPVPTWRQQDRLWRRARRCLADGRVRDAGSLCKALLDGCPHHPGARAIVADWNRKEQQVLSTARQLGDNTNVVSLGAALHQAREIVDLLPNHEETTRLVESLVQRVEGCRDALLDALHCLASGSLAGFTGAMDRASTCDADDPVAVDACVWARDLVDHLENARMRIADVVAHRQYRKALTLARKHRQLVTKISERSARILAMMEGGQAIHKEESL